MKKIALSFVMMVFTFLFVSCMSNITIDGLTSDIHLIVGQTYTLDFVTTDENGLVYEVLNDAILTLDGVVITAESAGDTTVKISAKSDPEIFVEVLVHVSNILLETDQTSITLSVGETDQVIASVNNGLGVTYTSEDETVFTVDETGQIVGMAEGQTNLIISSRSNPEVSVEVLVTIRKIIEISIEMETLELFVGEVVPSGFISNDGLIYESALDSIATIDEFGNISAIAPGVVSVTATSTYDDTISHTLTVYVGAIPETLTLEGPETVILGSFMQLTVHASPDNSLMHVTFESGNPDIITVDQDGQIHAVGQGITTITVTSDGDDNVISTLQVEVLNDMYVDATKLDGSTLEANGFIYEFGVNLFADIRTALLLATDGTSIHVNAGTYNESFTIELSNLILETTNDAVITQTVNVNADGVTIDGFTFEQGTLNVDNASNFTLKNNVFLGSDDPITLGVIHGQTVIKNNHISAIHTALTVTNQEVLTTDELQIVWNMIEAANAFSFELSGEDALLYARFNDISYIETAASVNGMQVDMTFNYWGFETLDMLAFSGVESKYLIKNYLSAEDIISEEDYDSSKPLAIVITNPVEEVWLGEPYDIDFQALPYEYVSNRYSFITGNAGIAVVSSIGIVSGVRSGVVTISVRYLPDTKIKDSIVLSVTTEPGIEIIPSQTLSNLMVGEPLTLSSIVFPYDIADEEVVYESDHPEIAFVNQDGTVISMYAGIVSFKAILLNDMAIQTTYTVEFYDAFDENNLMDLLTQNAVTYATPHTWTAVGVGYSYRDVKYDSVNRYYFSDIFVNTSKIIPPFYAIRPGELRPELPVGITKYNPENIYWIVIHDTASTTSNSGALAHANYLWNATSYQQELWVSWHYTIDDTEIYQHVPDEERAFHAGDGSTLPYLVENRPLTPDGNPAFGGGNRNGIGIETSVSDTYDTMEVWHRTAKFASFLLDKYNMPTTQIAYHHDFSGKNCPQTMRNAGLVWLFEEMIAIEYEIVHNYADWTISMTSNNPDYIDETGRVIAHPDRAMNATYTLTITDGDTVETKAFNIYLPGTQR